MKPHLCLAILLLLFCCGTQAQMTNRLVDEDASEAKAGTTVRKNIVKLYSRKDKGVVMVTSHRTQEVQLYIFDLEGTILYRCNLKCLEKKKIDCLEKGTYTYAIFNKDESIEEGKLIIK